MCVCVCVCTATGWWQCGISRECGPQTDILLPHHWQLQTSCDHVVPYMVLNQHSTSTPAEKCIVDVSSTTENNGNRITKHRTQLNLLNSFLFFHLIHLKDGRPKVHYVTLSASGSLIPKPPPAFCPQYGMETKMLRFLSHTRNNFFGCYSTDFTWPEYEADRGRIVRTGGCR